MDFINNLNLSSSEKQYLNQLVKKIEKLMKPPLFKHSVNTLKFAVQVAKNHRDGIDLFNLCVACILHDYGKIFGTGQLVKLAREHKLAVNDFELKLRPLLHGLVGDFLISRDFNIKDKNILRAVKYHTIGYCGMSMGDKILFVADKVEEGRKYEGVEEYRKIALKDINLCLIEVYKNIIMYVINKNKFLHPDTSRIWNSICGGS